jgi:glycerol-3-phosphate dehydrogenase (NAD(P)+)
VVAIPDATIASELQRILTQPTLRVYTNPDVVGCEVAGVVKNVIAIAAGMAEGMGFGDNTRATLITRGLAEMTRLGVALGGDPATFAGLAGMGDLIVTCWSPTGRNRRAGELIAQGTPPEEAAGAIGMVVEGLTTAPVLRDLSRRLGIELPITEGVCAVLEGASLTELVGQLMGRKPTSE